METCSVLHKVTRGDLRREPYPYVVVDDCLPQPYYEALAAAYPTDDDILACCRTHPFRPFSFDGGQARANDRYDISAFQVSERPESVAAIWREFVRYHTSAEFFAEVAALFGPVIRQTYPALEQTLGRPVEQFSTGVRFRSDCDISLDCQIGINTPATQRSSVRRVHTDAAVELFAGLLYFKDRDDDTEGGDLEIFRWKKPGRRYFVGSEADESAAELVDTVAYKANRMVMFLNTQDALHAVTPRAPSRHTRKLVNIIGEVDRSLPKGLFPRPKKRDADYLRRKIRALGRRWRGLRAGER